MLRHRTGRRGAIFGLFSAAADAVTEFASAETVNDAANTVPVTAAASDSLTPPAAPVSSGAGPFDGYAPVGGLTVAAENGVTLVNNAFSIATPGVYLVSDSWATVLHSVNLATVCMVLAVERAGQMTFGRRSQPGRIPGTGELGNLVAGTFEASVGNISAGVLALQAGDKVSLWVASNVTGTVTVLNAGITLARIGDA